MIGIPMRAASGRIIDLDNFTEHDVLIEDIAHGLACVNRFNGALKIPVSVAQHSVYVCRLCRQTEFRLQALLHDASEAYIGDITKWLKGSPYFEKYRELEDHIQRTIYRKFNVPEEQGAVVDAADVLMVRFEAMQGYPKDHNFIPDNYGALREGYGVPTPDEIAAIGRWKPWDWKWSQDVFMAEFRMAQAMQVNV
jgi:hypothetical protein